MREAWVPRALPEPLAFERRPRDLLLRRAQGERPTFTLSTLVAGRICAVAEPELAQVVLRSRDGVYRTGSANARVLPVLPAGTLLTLDGAEHRTRRRLLAPLFHGSSLERMRPAVREIVAGELERWPIGAAFSVLPGARRVTLSIAARLLLGLEEPSAVERLGCHLDRALHPYTMLASKPSLRRFGALSPQAIAARCRARFARGVDAILAGRPVRAPGAPPDAVSLLAEGAVDAPHDELFALLLAGYETTATALGWALLLLARRPDAVTALAAERRTGSGRLMVSLLAEVLRLRPPLVDIVREVQRVTMVGSTRLAPGALVMVAPPLIHAIAGDCDFEPTRFVDQRPDPRTWLPFGGSERRCLGASFALLELSEILGCLVERFTVEPAAERLEPARLRGTAMIPARGARIVLRPR